MVHWIWLWFIGIVESLLDYSEIKNTNKIEFFIIVLLTNLIKWSMELFLWGALWWLFLNVLLKKLLKCLNLIIPFLKHIEMLVEEIVFITAHFFIAYKVSSMLLNFNGTILKRSRWRNMNIMKESRTVIWIGSYQENS